MIAVAVECGRMIAPRASSPLRQNVRNKLTSDIDYENCILVRLLLVLWVRRDVSSAAAAVSGLF